MLTDTDLSKNTLAPLVRTAWAESPSLAIQLTTRFQYPRILKEVRWLLLNFPSKAVSEPEALPILLGDALPEDVSFQLKVCFISYFVVLLFLANVLISIFFTGLLSIPSQLPRSSCHLTKITPA